MNKLSENYDTQCKEVWLAVYLEAMKMGKTLPNSEANEALRKFKSAFDKRDGSES